MTTRSARIRRSPAEPVLYAGLARRGWGIARACTGEGDGTASRDV